MPHGSAVPRAECGDCRQPRHPDIRGGFVVVGALGVPPGVPRGGDLFADSHVVLPTQSPREASDFLGRLAPPSPAAWAGRPALRTRAGTLLTCPSPHWVSASQG